jgi:hypothetical protein
VTTAAKSQVREAWEALANHSFTCAECRRNPDRIQREAPDCPAEWDLYRAWKALWVAAGCPPVAATGVAA